MKNTIFLAAMVCLLAGCAGKGPTEIKIKTEAEVTSKEGLPVKIRDQDERPLPIKIAPNKTSAITLVASLIAVCATTFAAIAAWWAAFGARSSAKYTQKSVAATQKAAEGKLYYDLVQRYATTEMHNDVRELRSWSSKNKSCQEWKEALGKKEEWAVKLDLARRNVKFFFTSVLELYKAGYVRKDFAVELFRNFEADILTVIEPLDGVITADN